MPTVPSWAQRCEEQGRQADKRAQKTNPGSFGHWVLECFILAIRKYLVHQRQKEKQKSKERKSVSKS